MITIIPFIFSSALLLTSSDLMAQSANIPQRPKNFDIEKPYKTWGKIATTPITPQELFARCRKEIESFRIDVLKRDAAEEKQACDRSGKSYDPDNCRHQAEFAKKFRSKTIQNWYWEGQPTCEGSSYPCWGPVQWRGWNEKNAEELNDDISQTIEAANRPYEAMTQWQVTEGFIDQNRLYSCQWNLLLDKLAYENRIQAPTASGPTEQPAKGDPLGVVDSVTQDGITLEIVRNNEWFPDSCYVVKGRNDGSRWRDVFFRLEVSGPGAPTTLISPWFGDRAVRKMTHIESQAPILGYVVQFAVAGGGRWEHKLSSFLSTIGLPGRDPRFHPSQLGNYGPGLTWQPAFESKVAESIRDSRSCAGVQLRFAKSQKDWLYIAESDIQLAQDQFEKYWQDRRQREQDYVNSRAGRDDPSTPCHGRKGAAMQACINRMCTNANYAKHERCQ